MGSTGTVRFYRTNKADDEGHTPEPEELTEQFWASSWGDTWRKGGWMFERCFQAWLAESVGGWNPEADGQREAFDDLLSAVWGKRPLLIAYEEDPCRVGPGEEG